MSQIFHFKRSIQAAILIVSDTRTERTDLGGKLIREISEDAGVVIVEFSIVFDEIEAIQEKISKWLENEEIDVVITTGGTGIAKRDVTVEAVLPLLDKEVEGFGEFFRMLSFTEDVGTRAMLSRALAGTANDKVIFVLPGSIGAIKLGMQRLILPELKHFVYEATKHINQSPR